MGRWLLAVAAVGVSALVSACEDDTPASGVPVAGPDGGAASADGGPRGPGETPAPGSGGAFCDKTVGLLGRAFEGCCTAADKETDLYGLASGLISALTPVCVEELDASIARGRVLYHQDRAEACFTAYAATFTTDDCSKLTQTFADPAGTACREAYAGTGGVSAPCRGSHECLDGLTCVGQTKDADGACVVPPPIGEPCGPGRDDAGSRSASILEFGDHPDCAPGARCDRREGVCVAALAEGAQCSGSDECASPLRCYLGKCSSEGPSAADGPCTGREDCVRGLFCDRETDRCAPKRPGGGACINTAFDSECAGRCEGEYNEPGTCTAFCGSP
jgi:hypothetical protein